MQGQKSPDQNPPSITQSKFYDKSSPLKYGASQFYPKSKSKINSIETTNPNPSKLKTSALRSVNKSAFSENINDN